MKSKNTEQFSYGGQAVIEGVMMRGAHKAAIAVRDPNGEIQIHEEPLNKTLYRGFVAKTPFVRGLVGLWDAMGLGTKALMWSANVALVEGHYYRVSHNGKVGWVRELPKSMHFEGDLEAVPVVADFKTTKKRNTDENLPESGQLHSSEPTDLLDRPSMEGRKLERLEAGYYPVSGRFEYEENSDDFFSGMTTTGIVIFSLAFGIGLFFLFPTFVSGGVGEVLGINSTGQNIVEEAVKFGLLIGYIGLISQMEDVKRLFRYHGAEHKTINAYEAGAALTPETVNTYPIEHPRCGTAFILNVIILSIIINTLIGRFDNNFLILIPVRLLTIPIVAGIAYEWLRFTAKNLNNPLIRILIKPNLALQRMTTREPDDAMCEVAIAALERVLVAEGLEEETSQPIPTTNPATATD